MDFKSDMTCPGCGMSLPLQCADCKEFNPLYAKYCCNCGSQLQQNNYSINLRKSSGVLNENRRNVAVIFADVSGFTALSEKMDPEEIREIINGCFEYITTPVYELEGTIDKFIGDCVMILFGAKYSHSDDAFRAVKCALRMMELIKSYSRQYLSDKQLELKLSIGINYGLVVTGKVGNRFDNEYTVMGDTVNTAQRLQSCAGAGNILVSERCYDYTGDLIEYSSPREIRVKNKEKPMKCYRAIKIRKDAETERIDLIERDKELEHLVNAYKDIHGKRYITVLGEAGIGKTSLIKKFLKKQTEEGVQKVWINCNPMNKSKSYHVINSIISQLVGIAPEDDMKVKKNKLKTFIEYIFYHYDREKIQKNYNIITLIMGIEIGEDFHRMLKSMDYKDLMREIKLQLKLFFERLYDVHTYIIVVDDLQWADDLSLQLLMKLVNDISNDKSFYLFTSQTGREELDTRHNVLQLKKLSGEGMADLIKREFQCMDVDKVFLDAILELTNGNPLYVLVYIGAVKRSRQYYIENNKLFINRDYIGKVPDSIENIILANLSTLNPSTQSVLQLASCIGKEFNINWVKKILLNHATIEDDISELIRTNMISLRSVYISEGIINKVYVFNQDTVRTVIHNSILNRKRNEYYTSICELIERDYSDSIEQYYTELYLYCVSANNIMKAKDYSYKAACKFRKDYNFYNALEYFNNFIKLADNSRNKTENSKLMQSYREIGYINFVQGEVEKAIENLNKAISYASVSEDIYSIKLMMVEIYNDRAQYDAALRMIEELEGKVRENSNLYGKMLLLKCTVYYFKRDKDMLSTAQASEAILSKTKDYENLAQTENLIGLYYFTQGDTSNALYYFSKVYEYCEKVSSIKIISSIANNLGMLYHMTGRISKSLEFYNKALEFSKSISNLRSYITASINLGIVYLEKGSFQKAETLLKKALERAQQVSHIYLQCTALLNIGEIAYKRGSYEEANQYFFKALILSLKHEMKAEEGISYISISKVHMKQGNGNIAEELLDKAFPILSEINETSGLIDYYICKCKLQINNNNTERAEEYWETANTLLKEAEDDFKKIILLRLRGRILAERTQYEKALACYDSSIRLSNQLESEYQTAKSYYEKAILNGTFNDSIHAGKNLGFAKEHIAKVDACELKKIIECCKLSS